MTEHLSLDNKFTVIQTVFIIIIITWKEGKPLTWEVTVACSLADLYFDASVRAASSTVELVALRKMEKYSALERTDFFQPIAVESLGPVNSAAY